MTKIIVVLLFLCLCLKEVDSAESKPRKLPHHDYALRFDSAQETYNDVVLRLQNSIINALKETKNFPSEYPKPCRLRYDTLQRKVIPYVSKSTDKEANGILLDENGHYLTFSFVDYADSRVYLYEIYLVDKKTSNILKRSESYELPRITIGFPFLGDAYYTGLLEAVRKGIIKAGAKEIFFK